LDAEFSERWLRFARAKGRWQRSNAWITKFREFVDRLSAEEGSKGLESHEVALASNRVCFLFLLAVAREQKGFTRVRSARRFLSEERRRNGGSSLSSDLKIGLLVDGVARSTPRQRWQKEAVGADEVMAILGSPLWGSSTDWFKRQVALMVGIGFVTLMRLDEVRRLLLRGIRFKLDTGEEYSFSEHSRVPRLQEVAGVLLLVVWRKAGQELFAWIPVSCRTVLGLLLIHLSWLARNGLHNMDVAAGPYLFQSRQLRKRLGYQPTGRKVESKSFLGQFRAALSAVCGIAKALLARFGGHSLRIGGSNWMRITGLSDRLHRLMGGWASLTSSTDYMQLSVSEQFAMTSKFALTTSRHAGPSRVEGGVSLDATRVLQLAS
jgi:hypothetical protein